MLSCKFQSCLLVFKITKGCHQDFSLLHIVIYSLYLAFSSEKWLSHNVFSPYNHGFILPSKVRKMDYQNTKHIGIFTQFSTRMSMDKTFGMFKGRFKILLKRANIPLCHMPNLVMACIHLHNMCIIRLDGFNMDQALEAQKNAQIEGNTTFGNLKEVNFLGG